MICHKGDSEIDYGVKASHTHLNLFWLINRRSRQWFILWFWKGSSRYNKSKYCIVSHWQWSSQVGKSSVAAFERIGEALSHLSANDSARLPSVDSISLWQSQPTQNNTINTKQNTYFTLFYITLNKIRTQ